jgi:two-component system, cell cycle sensor histidine kinase and response regulator CckA
MKVKTKILWTLLGMSLLVALVGALAVNRLQAAAMASVTREAQDVARLMGYLLMSGPNKLATSPQEMVARLHQTQGRDVELVDPSQLVLAAAISSHIGKRFTGSPGDEVGATIKDRQVRTFPAVSQEYPTGIKQIVVPVEGEAGPVIGAVILEYTPLYNELMQSTRRTIRHVVLTGFASVAIALLIALYVGRSFVRPLQQLTNVAAGFASGRTNLPIPLARKDEIGELATAFNNMVQKRQRAEDELRRLRDQLELRVVERVAELAKVNEALRAENTERKRAEETLRESEEKFRQLAENITDVFWMTSPDLKTIHYISPGYELIWGRSTESLYRDPHQWVDAILPEEREHVFALFATLSGNASKVSVEYRIARPDGTVRWVHDRGFQVRDAAGTLVRLAGMASDVTERKEIEEMLQRQQTELRVLFDFTPAMIFFKDTQNAVLRVNKRFADTIGKSVEEIEGKGYGEIYAPEAAKHYADDLEVIRSGAPKLGIIEPIRNWEGKELWVQTDKVPVCDKDGKVTGIVVMCQDITARRRFEIQLFQSQKMETVGKLAGGVAHEFNSIMTAIIGQGELMLGDLPEGSPLAKNVTEISKAADRAATLTRQLLAYGRKQLLKPETLDLNRVLASMERMFRHLMGGDVVTQIIPGASLQAVKADAGQIEQVIMNIAINARDAMPNGGKFILETANVSFDQESVVRYPELKAGDYVMLAITDTGKGMTAEVKARVFEPFFSTKEVGEGTGLGLSTCYGIIKQSGGHISVYSELARGSTFKIYLPQVEHEAKVAKRRVDSPDLPRGTETILLVEDDPALREMAATLLRRLGYTVLPAANGIEALNLKQQRDVGHIDLLFTDVVMPHMSGKELSERVQALYPHTRVLFTSAYTENAIIHQGVLNKGLALLQKPFTPSALAQKLRQVLDQPV